MVCSSCNIKYNSYNNNTGVCQECKNKIFLSKYSLDYLKILKKEILKENS